MKTNKLFSILIALIFLAKIANAQWQQTNGPYSGCVYCFTSDSANLYMGTQKAGVFRSNDNGNSWIEVNNGLTNKFVQALAISDDKIFAGTFGFIGGGLFSSNNHGNNWIKLNFGWPIYYDISISSIAIDGENIFVGSEYIGIFRSTDGGNTWTEVNNGLTNQNINALAISGKNIFAGTQNGMFLSTDNGDTWTAVNNGLPEFGIYTIAISGSNVFIGGYADWIGCGVFLSTDNGNSWTAVNNGLTNLYVFSLAITGGNIFAGTLGGVFVSNNNGNTWMSSSNGLTNPWIKSFGVKGSDILAGTSYSGVFRTSDFGNSWTEVNEGLKNANMKSLEINSSGIFAGTWGSGLFFSDNNGDSWNKVDLGVPGIYIPALEINDTNIIIGTAYGDSIRVLLSNDNGITWVEITENLPQVGVFKEFVISGSNIFAAIENSGIYLSTNNGATWVPKNNGLSNSFVSSIAINGSDIFAGTYAYDGGGIFWSNDNGNNWTIRNNGLTTNYVWRLAIFNNNIFAGTDQGIFLSTDNGITWSEANAGLTNFNVTAFAAIDTCIFAGTDDGVFLSTDNGTTWSEVSEGLANKDVTSLTIDDTYIFAGTFSGSVWKRPLSEVFSQIPEAITSNAINVNIYNATLKGSVNPHMLATTVDFEYGPSISYGNVVTVNGSPFNGSTLIDVNYPLIGLTPNTTYHYRLKATNSLGSAYGNDEQFTTSEITQIPEAITSTAINVNINNVTLKGAVNPHNIATTVDFEYGSSISYGNVVRVNGSPFIGSAFIDVNYSLTGLSPNTTYHFRIKATNSLGSAYGNDEQFTTNSSGIANENDIEKAVLFPNPAKDKMTIEIPQSTILHKCKGFIYNSLGKLCLEQWLSAQTEIDLRNLTKGVYNIKIKCSYCEMVRMFIKE